jgi:hypothetical protein
MLHPFATVKQRRDSRIVLATSLRAEQRRAMARRPTREWLEALVSGALLGGCASAPPAAVEPAPTPVTSSEPEPAPPPAPASASATPPIAPAPAPAVELAAFDAKTCQGPVPKRSEPACVDTKPEPDREPDLRTTSAQNLSNVRPSCAIDGIVVYRVTGTRTKKGVEIPGETSEVARSGEPCAGAADQEACGKHLKDMAFPPRTGFGDGDSRLYLVVARAGKLELVANREQLVGLVGAVDSKQDAAALLWLDGWGGSCGGLQAQGGSFVLPKLKLGFLCPPMVRGQAGVDIIPNLPEGYSKDGSYRVQLDASGKLKVSYLGGADPANANIACGRRPSGLDVGDGHRGPDVGAYLAECASLEAAAVIAFELLASELKQHGAPALLVERCQAAAEDERRHTQLMLEAARRYGVEPPLPAPHTRPLPSLLELARENIVEGCVRETWGALSALWQARTAQDPELAALYGSIAPDELSHAELSWDIHAWLAPRVGQAGRLQQLAELARAELLAAQADASPAVAHLAGAPGRGLACELIRQLAA